jgi:hypothetical protein
MTVANAQHADSLPGLWPQLEDLVLPELLEALQPEPEA